MMEILCGKCVYWSVCENFSGQPPKPPEVAMQRCLACRRRAMHTSSEPKT